jgi:hypothetical protein
MIFGGSGWDRRAFGHLGIEPADKLKPFLCALANNPTTSSRSRPCVDRLKFHLTVSILEKSRISLITQGVLLSYARLINLRCFSCNSAFKTSRPQYPVHRAESRGSC